MKQSKQNNQHKELQRAIKTLNIHYYGNIFVLSVLFLLSIFKLIPFFEDIYPNNVTIERYAIVIAILAIPISLKFFATQLKKLPRPLEIATAAKKYKKASFLRIYTLSVVMVMQITLFTLFRNMNFFWITVVLLVVIFLFCMPSYSELEALTETNPAEKREGDVDSAPEDESKEKEGEESERLNDE